MKITIKITHKEFRQLCKDFLADCEEFKKSCKTTEEYKARVKENEKDPYYSKLFTATEVVDDEEDEEIEGFAEELDEELDEEEF